MITLKDTFGQAFHALGNHRLRTFLSIMGITIGITAVIAVSTISKGGNYVVYSELETFGLNSVWVYRNWNDDSPLRRARDGSGINNDDYLAITDLAVSLGIHQLSPIVRQGRRNLQIRNGSHFANADLLGVNTDYVDIVNDALTDGRNFTHTDISRKNPVALITPNIASKLFPSERSPIGQEFRIQNRRVVVVGILAEKSRDFLSSIGSAGGQNANDRILIPYSLMQLIRGDTQISNLHIEVAEFEFAAQTAESVVSLLDRRHRGNYAYSSETMASYIETTDRILGGVGLIGVIAASISLLVGGMGIMNMMGTSVLERTREIGIRKAIGATESDIMRQFLFEAAIISIVGGILGLLVGGIASASLSYITRFPLLPSVTGVVTALVVSLLVGVLSGYLPARRAARLHPVQALRAE
ncbi:MAG: ABC transporter permease [Granulosicoccus sp.]|nr:ABC transporter permease [Granulosicoccus sp.]